MSKGLRATAVVIALAAAAAVIISVAVWLGSYPPTVAAASTSNPKVVNIHLQTVGGLGYGRRTMWVSYLTQQADGKWVHTTILKVPANATVNVTVDQYDSGSNIRNPLMYQVQGTVGGVAYLNGKPYSTYHTDLGIGHTFTIPQLGVSVPLPGVDGNAPNFCNQAAPCPTSTAHNTVKFSFHTGAPGTYTWQCFVPCGVGYIAGFGGPMSTYGYMNGYLKVVA